MKAKRSSLKFEDIFSFPKSSMYLEKLLKAFSLSLSPLGT